MMTLLNCFCNIKQQKSFQKYEYFVLNINRMKGISQKCSNFNILFENLELNGFSKFNILTPFDQHHRTMIPPTEVG